MSALHMSNLYICSQNVYIFCVFFLSTDSGGNSLCQPNEIKNGQQKAKKNKNRKTIRTSNERLEEKSRREIRKELTKLYLSKVDLNHKKNKLKKH